MARKNLANCEEYFLTLKCYAKALKIKIIYAHIDCEGIYIPNRRTIKLDPDLDDQELIATLLHELGHSLDDALVTKTTYRHLDKAYPRVYDNKGTKQQLQTVLSCEKRAWICGKAIAKRLKIPLGKWYNRISKRNLRTYRES